MFQTKVVEKFKTHLMLNKNFPENRVCYQIMWTKYGGTGQARDDSTAHAPGMLDN
jgi:hypothetical protein